MTVREWIGQVESPGWVVAGAMLVGWLFTSHQLTRSRAHAGELALAATNAAARADTSHRLALSRGDSIRLLGDSLAAVTRLAVQERQHSDALDRAAQIDRRALVVLRGSIAALRVSQTPSVAPVTTLPDGERLASWHIRRVPWTMDATAHLPAAGAGRLDATVTIDTAAVQVRLGCEAVNRDGIRPARVLAIGPPWLTLAVGLASQDPAVCPSPTLAPHGAAWWRPSIRPALAGGLGSDGKPWGGLILVRWPGW